MNNKSRFRSPGQVFTLLLLLVLSGCGGGGGGGGSSQAIPNTGTPDQAASVLVSGQIQAPNGQIAFQQRRGISEDLLDLFFPRAFAQLTGGLTVPNGTRVELVRLDATGQALDILATTTTIGSAYSFDLTQLGLAFSSDLVVRVVNAATGARMQAFVTGKTVDINPVSEAAVRLVIDQLLARPGVKLSDLSVRQLADITASIDLLTTIRQSPFNNDIESTVNAVLNDTLNDGNLMGFVTSLFQTSGAPVGPGDIGNFFPLDQGISWTYQGTDSINGAPTVSFSNTVTVSGTRTINGTTATILVESNPSNINQPASTPLVKNSLGVFDWEFVEMGGAANPAQIVRFPVQSGDTYKQFTASNFDFGFDIDSDGISDLVDIDSDVSILGVEDITVPAGDFAGAIKIEISTRLDIRLSSDSSIIPASTLTTVWYAQDTGLVKQVTQVDIGVPGSAILFTSYTTEELFQVTGLQGSGSAGGETGNAAVTVLDLSANDILYDPVSQRIYASSAGSQGNSIAIINPVTTQIESTVFIGSEPGPLAISSDGTTLYVGLGSAAAVRSYDIPGGTPGALFTLGQDSFFGPMYAEDIEVMPGNASTIAVSLAFRGSSPRYAGVAVFDSGVKRQLVTPGHTGSNVIEFSESSEILYGYNNETTDFGLRTMDITPGGISVTNVSKGLISGFGTDIRYDSGRVYSSGGSIIQVVDAATGTLAGQLTLNGAGSSSSVAPDSSLNRVFVLKHNGSIATIQSFDASSFLPVGQVNVGNIASFVSTLDLIRWGSKGFAFRTNDNTQTNQNKLYIINPDSLP
ncbi:MAG: YncE family protein [Acidiferrobacterales bacterium]